MVRVPGPTRLLTLTENKVTHSILNNEASKDLEYESGRSVGNYWWSYVFKLCTRSKDRMGSSAATNAALTGRDFFYVNWQVDEPHSAKAISDWARKICLCVGAPTDGIDPDLNNLKREVITALLDSDLVSSAREKGYVAVLGRLRSEANSRKNKHTTLLQIVLDDRHRHDKSEESIKANINAVHEAVGVEE